VPKQEGGLGIKKLEVWTQASMLIRIWNLFARAGSLWVAWVEEVWLKGKSLWQLTIPHSCSWSWRKILKLRPIAKIFLSYKVGDGRKIFIWHDNWHPNGYLLDKYGYRTIYDAGYAIGPKLFSIIRHGEWYCPNACSESLVEIQSPLPEVTIGTEDVPVWNSRKGTFSCSETWDKLRVKSPIVNRYNTVWFPLAIPRHSFILWLAFRDALNTKEKLCLWGFNCSSVYLFCHAQQESKEHFLFSCSFSRRIWRVLMADCLVVNPPVDWDSVVWWFQEKACGKSLKSYLCKLCFGAAVYNLWKQMNDLLHGNIPRS
jgi:hypothetical protein